MARKTIHVESVRELANRMIDASPPANVEGREAIAHLTREVLLTTDQYHGFRYTRTEGSHEDGTWKVLDESYIRFH